MSPQMALLHIHTYIHKYVCLHTYPGQTDVWSVMGMLAVSEEMSRQCLVSGRTSYLFHTCMHPSEITSEYYNYIISLHKS